MDDDAPYLSREKSIDVSDIPPLVTHPHDTVDGAVEETDGPSLEAGYAYILMEEKNGYATGYYQVGSTTDPKKRKSELQAGNVRPLSYTRCETVRDLLGAGAAVQAALDRYGVDLGGGTEWFFANTSRADAFYFTFMQEVSRFQ